MKADTRGTVTAAQLRKAISKACGEEFTKHTHDWQTRHIEAFLSSYVYNDFGHTDASNITDQVYGSISDHIGVPRPKPPPSLVDKELPQPESNMSKVKKLSERLVTKIFTDRKSQYTIFKSFDTDGDGYVSYNDFIKRVERLEIEGATKEASLALAKFLDPDKNGFIEFKDFTKGF